MTIEGWNSAPPCLAEWVAELRPRLIVDVGVWKGGSTIHFAKLLEANGINGYVIAVDTWLGSPEHCEDLVIAPGNIPPVGIYTDFLWNVSEAKLWTYIAALPQTSHNAAQILAQRGITPDMVHIDAAHDYPSVLSDCWDYWHLLRSGGYLCGDDFHAACPDVCRAVAEFSARVGCGVVVDDSFKWLVRKP